jgi:hypothetical protein
MDPDQLSKAFVEHYYSTFDSNTPNLLGLFQESSMLSFEGERSRERRTSATSSAVCRSSSASTTSLPWIASRRVPLAV